MSISQYYKSVSRGFRDRSKLYSKSISDLRVKLIRYKQDLYIIGFA